MLRVCSACIACSTLQVPLSLSSRLLAIHRQSLRRSFVFYPNPSLSPRPRLPRRFVYVLPILWFIDSAAPVLVSIPILVPPPFRPQTVSRNHIVSFPRRSLSSLCQHVVPLPRPPLCRCPPYWVNIVQQESGCTTYGFGGAQCAREMRPSGCTMHGFLGEHCTGKVRRSACTGQGFHGKQLAGEMRRSACTAGILRSTLRPSNCEVSMHSARVSRSTLRQWKEAVGIGWAYYDAPQWIRRYASAPAVDYSFCLFSRSSSSIFSILGMLYFVDISALDVLIADA